MVNNSIYFRRVFITLVSLLFCIRVVDSNRGTCATSCECKQFPARSSTLSMKCDEDALKFIPRSRNADAVIRLYVSSTSIASLNSGSFKEYANVRYLHVTRGEIRKIPNDTFIGLSNLEYINLSFNNINYIHQDAFIHLNLLNALHLMGNPLILKDELLIKSDFLKKLDLSNCELTFISPQTLYELPKLEILNVSNNRLTTISDKFLLNFQLKSLDLRNNFWACDCKLRDVLNSFSKDPKLVVYLPDYSSRSNCSDEAYKQEGIIYCYEGVDKKLFWSDCYDLPCVGDVPMIIPTDASTTLYTDAKTTGFTKKNTAVLPKTSATTNQNSVTDKNSEEMLISNLSPKETYSTTFYVLCIISVLSCFIFTCALGVLIGLTCRSRHLRKSNLYIESA